MAESQWWTDILAAWGDGDAGIPTVTDVYQLDECITSGADAVMIEGYPFPLRPTWDDDSALKSPFRFVAQAALVIATYHKELLER